MGWVHCIYMVRRFPRLYRSGDDVGYIVFWCVCIKLDDCSILPASSGLVERVLPFSLNIAQDSSNSDEKSHRIKSHVI